MRLVKVIFASLLAILGIVFILENRLVLEQAILLKLDLYLFKVETPHIPLWVLILFTFFLGVFTASLYGLYEIIKQRQTIRQLRHSLEVMGQELKRRGPAEEPPAAATE
jgi:uncharacterized integral membrane protein